MTKKIIPIAVIIAVLTVGYFVFKNSSFIQMEPFRPQTEDFTKPSEEEIANLPLPGSTTTDDDVELAGEITTEVKLSSKSTGVGIILLGGDKKYPCYLTKVTDKCDYSINEEMKLVATPAEGFIFQEWLSGCDNISTTNLKNDTCEINAHSSKKVVEVGFMKS